MNKLYIIGSLRNPKINEVASTLRVRLGVEVFDDWFAAGPEADDYWKKYEEAKGHSYEEALAGYAATHVFNFDKLHLDTADAAVLVLPAGRSAHLEAGYMVGQGKPVFILLDEVSGNLRWDVMYKFVTGVVRNVDDLVERLQALERKPEPFPYPSFGHGAPALAADLAHRCHQVGALARLRERQRHEAVADQLALVERDQRHRQRGHQPAQPRHHQVGHVVGGVVAAAARHCQKRQRRALAQRGAQVLEGMAFVVQQPRDDGRSFGGFSPHA